MDNRIGRLRAPAPVDEPDGVEVLQNAVGRPADPVIALHIDEGTGHDPLARLLERLADDGFVRFLSGIHPAAR